MSEPPHTDRRTVLKATAGLVSIAGASGAAAAQEGQNGRGIGAFLNERPEFKEMPVWSSGIADKTGESTVTIDVGTMTSIAIPEEDFPTEPPDEGPFAFAPRAVKVSPGTTVEWEWTGNPFLDANGDPVSPKVGDGPWPHDVHSLEESGGSTLFHSGPPQGTGTFEEQFDETGTYRYYCTPHGNPGPKHPNLFGMRGAVLVSDD